MSDIQLLYYIYIYSGYNLTHLVNAMFNAFPSVMIIRGRREHLGDIYGQGYPTPAGKHNPGEQGRRLYLF